MEQRRSFGGVAGNEILTCAIAAVLTCLLLAEGVTLLRMGPLLIPHMFIGLVLVPLVLLKLGSTGYRFVRYYAHTPAYREKGPPLLPLRVLAPVLVAATLAVFVTGVVLLIDGHKSNTLMLLHKVSFIVWGAVFGIHFLAYLPRMLRSLRDDWSAPPAPCRRRGRIQGHVGRKRPRRRARLGVGAAADDRRLAGVGLFLGSLIRLFTSFRRKSRTLSVTKRNRERESTDDFPC